MRRISQQQIAQDLGVSQSLVSIVLNGRRDGISKEAYNRIWDYALAKGYKPRGMRIDNFEEASRIRSIGYFLRAPLKLATKSNFFSHIHQGVYDCLREKRVNYVYLGSEDDSPDEMAQLAWQQPYLAGVIIMGQVKPDFLAKVVGLDVPIVYVSARAPGQCHSVNSNERQAAGVLVDHLYDLGHRRIAYMGGLCAPMRHEERLGNLRLALAQRNLALADEDILLCTNRERNERNEGAEVAARILARPPAERPTALVAVNGMMARGALSFLAFKGVRIGSEISITAFDRTRVCHEELPTITGAGAIPEDMGRMAAEMIMRAGEEPPGLFDDRILPAELMIGESSGRVETAGSGSAGAPRARKRAAGAGR